MSLAQREVWNNAPKEKQMNFKHIEIIRFDAGKISVKEYVGERIIQPVTYQPAIIKMIGARLLVINPDCLKQPQLFAQYRCPMLSCLRYR